MTLELDDSVRRILEEVRLLTGKGVEFIERRDMQVYAGVKMARSSMPAHLMLYKPRSIPASSTISLRMNAAMC